MATQVKKLSELIGYQGEGQWYKAMEVTLGQPFVIVEILSIKAVNEEIRVVGHVVDDSYQRTIVPGQAKSSGVVAVSGLNPSSQVYSKS